MILYNDKLISYLLRSRKQGFFIHWFHRIGIDHANGNSLTFQLVIGLQGFVQRDTRSDNCQPVIIRAAYNLAATNLKFFVRTVYNRRLFAGGSHVNNAVMISHLGYQLCRLIGVAWIDDGTTKDGAQHGQILERHLGRSILTNRDPCMGTYKTNIGAGDGSHTNEIIGTREERGKGRSERYLMAYAHAHSCSHQLLFGDILLEKAIRAGFGKLFSIGRVAYLAVQPNDIGIGSTKGH